MLLLRVWVRSVGRVWLADDPVVEKKNFAGYVWLDLETSSRSMEPASWRQERGLVVLSTGNLGLVAIIPVEMGLVGDVVLSSAPPSIRTRRKPEIFFGENRHIVYAKIRRTA